MSPTFFYSLVSLTKVVDLEMSNEDRFIDVALPNLSKKPRQVFVAYSFRLYDKRDYRKPFEEIGKAFGVDFIFADEKISSLHILQKIANQTWIHRITAALWTAR